MAEEDVLQLYMDVSFPKDLFAPCLETGVKAAEVLQKAPSQAPKDDTRSIPSRQVDSADQAKQKTPDALYLICDLYCTLILE